MEYALFRLEKRESLPAFQSGDANREVADQKSILEGSGIKSSGEIAS
jgi:hypothetical protein